MCHHIIFSTSALTALQCNSVHAQTDVDPVPLSQACCIIQQSEGAQAHPIK